MANERAHYAEPPADAVGAAHVEAALRNAELDVDAMDPSNTQRRLAQMLAVLRRVVASWNLHPPSARQVAFLHGLVAEVTHEARNESPTLRFRRPA